MNQANPVRTDLAHLRTEARNPRTLHIDTLPTPDMVRLMCEENRVVEDAVAAQADAIAAAIDIIAARLDAGGHLIYVGAGTSGRLGVVDASFVGLDSTPVMANTKQNNPKSFAKNKFSKENHPKSDPDCALGVHSASNQHNERRYEFYWGYKSHVLVDCISGLPLYELTTPGNISDSAVAADILAAVDQTISLKECAFLADKGYDVKSIYNTVKTVYEGEAFIPLNPRGTKASKTLSAGNPVCEAGLAMHKDGKTTDGKGGIRQKYCCPFRQSKTGVCPCNHKNWNNGKRNRGCTKYKTIPTDYRLSIDRECLHFKRIYALRTECERYNSRFKASGQERLWVRNGSSAANLNTLAHISALVVALAAVLHGSHSYRSAKQLRRSA